MNYDLIRQVISLVEEFEVNCQSNGNYGIDLDGFQEWVVLTQERSARDVSEPDWEGKAGGRSADSVINTLIVHMNRYARSYSRSAIHGSGFSTQEEFIYLINLKALGAMSKMQLIKKNVQEKSVGMQIISRLLKQGWIKQSESEEDKRSKTIEITHEGLAALENQMENIRAASRIVTGDLSHTEKNELIRLLQKLDRFHHPIFEQNLSAEELLKNVIHKRV